MILKKINISNYRGIKETISVDFALFNCIVGQNDAGKSTILKAIDSALNDNNPLRSDFNVESDDSHITIELLFDCRNTSIYLGEEISTYLESEELTNQENLLVWKKTWTVNESGISKPKLSICRKKYEGTSDFVLKTEQQLIAQCTANGIDTAKGNGEAFNNVEKREKLREFNRLNNIDFTYEYEELPTSGTSKSKAIADAIKKALPAFQYFKADTSLSDTDTTIQKHFKEIALELIQTTIETNEMEEVIKEKLESILQNVTDKINSVLKSSENVEPKVEFDWSKLISTSFVSTTSGSNIPLSSRGDGFRRITMMSYFEYLAETKRVSDKQQIIFGFEEPETFLHPSAQDNLFDKLSLLQDNGYQIIISTHSPSIVGRSKKENLIHISKPENIYTINQVDVDYKTLAKDLGIKPDNTFTPLFSTSKLLFLVEGVDDANAMHHKASLYKKNNLIAATFEDLNVNIIPIGGCGGVKHWVNLDLFTKLEKPFFIFLDSDKLSENDPSPNEAQLTNYGLTLGTHFISSKKRELENYIPTAALNRIHPGSNYNYGDYDDVKKIVNKKAAEKYYRNLTFDELRLSWFNGTEDEFITLYQVIVSKLN